MKQALQGSKVTDSSFMRATELRHIRAHHRNALGLNLTGYN